MDKSTFELFLVILFAAYGIMGNLTACRMWKKFPEKREEDPVGFVILAFLFWPIPFVVYTIKNIFKPW